MIHGPNARVELSREVYFHINLSRVWSRLAADRFLPYTSQHAAVQVAGAVVEAELGLLEEGWEAGAAEAVELCVSALGVAPEALDALMWTPPWENTGWSRP